MGPTDAAGRIAAAVACVLGLGACSAGDPTAAPSASAVGSASPSAVATATSADDVAANLAALAEYICTDRLAEPDRKILSAITAARAETRSATEVEAMFREAQDAIDALVPAVPPKYPRLAAELQAYSDTLGRARVRGDVGLGELADAKEQLNAVCANPE
jgi:hypothetical protein